MRELLPGRTPEPAEVRAADTAVEDATLIARANDTAVQDATPMARLRTPPVAVPDHGELAGVITSSRLLEQALR